MKNINKIPLLLGLMLFFVQGDIAAAAPLLVALANDFGISISEAGYTVAAYLIPFGVFTILFGPLGDKWGRGKILKTAAFGTAIFSLLGALAPNYITLITFRAFNGMFGAGLIPVSMALIGELAGNDNLILHKRLSKTMSLMFFGGAIAPLIGGTLSYLGSWRLVYLVYGVFELFFAAVLLVSIKGFDKINRDITIINSYRDAFSNKALMRTVSIVGFLGIAVLGGFSYLGKFVGVKFNLTLLQIGLMLTLYGVGTIIGGRLGHKIQSKIGNRYFIFSAFIGVLALLIFCYVNNIWFVGAAILLFGASFTLIQPKILAISQRLLPKRKGTVMSLISLNMSLGGGVGTLLYGLILRQYDFKIIYLIGAFVFLVIAFLATYVTSRTKQVQV